MLVMGVIGLAANVIALLVLSAAGGMPDTARTST